MAIYYSMVTSTFPGAGQTIAKCNATVPGSCWAGRATTFCKAATLPETLGSF